jgi:tetratricopeptide (TPR) repeat protein
MDRKPSSKSVVIACLLVAFATVAVYWQTTRNGFINFDDPDYVQNNPRVQAGLTMETVKWAFTSYHSSNWHPMTWLSHALDCQLFGLNPAGHHAVNLGFHLANVVILLLLLRSITGQLWPATLVAALFAVHPLHVESVAWISERKDVLSTFFFLLTVTCYALYSRAKGETLPGPAKTRTRRAIWYFGAICFLALGLMSKPMLVTVPFLLLLLDFWPLDRMSFVQGRLLPANFWRLILEKLPFFGLAIASAIATIIVQHASGAVVALSNSSVETRLANALLSYGRYLEKTFFPFDLAVFYPYISVDFGTPIVWGAIVLLGAISLITIAFARERPWVFVGWFWFIGTLVPVIGIVQVGRQAMADRYTYLPHMGFFILLSWTIFEISKRSKAAQRIALGLSVSAILACALLTARQVSLWKDSTTLFAHAAQVTKNNFVAHAVLANTLMEQGNLEEALKEATTALRINPRYPEGLSTLGHIYTRLKNYEQAAASFQEAISLDPLFGDAYGSLANTLLQQGAYADAEEAAREAVRLAPLSLPAWFAYATALHKQNRLVQAEEAYHKTLELDPSLFAPRRYLGNVLFALGRTEEAESEFKKALELKPADGETMLALGLVEMQLGVIEKAEELFNQSLQINSTNPIAHVQLAAIKQSRKDYQAAAQHLEKAVSADPNWAEALNNCSWLLATCPDAAVRNGAKAVELGQRAVSVTGERVPMFIGTLAAAYAEAGLFRDAVRSAEKAIAVAEKAGQKELAERNRDLLALYRTGKPYHEPP